MTANVDMPTTAIPISVTRETDGDPHSINAEGGPPEKKKNCKI